MSRKMAIHNGKLTSNLDANGFAIINATGGGGGGGGGGTTNYEALTNKPQIGGVELSGNKSLSDLGAVSTNDSRLADARTPTAHKSTHATGGADALSPADIGAISESGGEIAEGFSLTRDSANLLSFSGEYFYLDGIAKYSEQAMIEGTGVSFSDFALSSDLPYPLSQVVGGALRDRTINTASGGGTFTFPAKVGTASRDFSLVISAQETAPSVSFPTTGVTYVSEQSASELWSAEAGKINEWYFHENGTNRFAVFHRAFSTVTQGS